MWMRGTIGCFGMILLFPPSVLGQTEKPKSENAALKYFQAFALLPKLDDERSKIIGDRDNAVFSTAAVKLLEDCVGPMKLMHAGARLPHCDWGLEMDGVNTLLPHVSKVRELANIAFLRARFLLEQGKHRSGIDDVFAVIMMARHTSTDHTLISYLVQIALEQQAIDLLARFMPKFDKETIEMIGKRLDTLPPGGNASDCILFERDHMVKWQIRQIQNQSYGANQALEALVRASGGPKGPISQLEELSGRYEELANIMKLQGEQFDAKWAAFNKSLEGNTFAKMLLPAVDKIHDAQMRSLVRWLMFRAALAVSAGGSRRIEDFRDPVGAGPFEHKALPDGFALKSKLIYKDQPVTLIVGLSKAP